MAHISIQNGYMRCRYTVECSWRLVDVVVDSLNVMQCHVSNTGMRLV
jgi:hypothetical protein